jgi:hypothetical protein
MSKLKVLIGFGLILFVIITLSGCYYDSEEYLYSVPGGNNCVDTTIFTYSGGVQPILSKYCYTCHSNSAAASMGGNVKLQDYADVKAKAAAGNLYGSIAHTGSYSQMPKGSAQLADCYLTVVKKWIAAGMNNN